MEVKIEKKEKVATATGSTNSVKVTGTVTLVEVEKTDGEKTDGEKTTTELSGVSVQFYDVDGGSHIGYCNMTKDSFTMNVWKVSKNLECTVAFNDFVAAVLAQL